MYLRYLPLPKSTYLCTYIPTIQSLKLCSTCRLDDARHLGNVCACPTPRAHNQTTNTNLPTYNTYYLRHNPTLTNTQQSIGSTQLFHNRLLSYARPLRGDGAQYSGHVTIIGVRNSKVSTLLGDRHMIICDLHGE